MSTHTTIVKQSQTVQPARRDGRRTNKAKNRGARQTPILDPTDEMAGSTGAEVAPTSIGVPIDNEDDSNMCWICAEPVKYYSLSECNHRTCHVCALRLRALYKKLDCTFCKHPQTLVIFTTSPEDAFSAFSPERIPFKDSKLSIAFESQDIMEEALLLLRFNCPDPECDYIASGWSDLKVHVRALHGKSMCDICIRSKKVFSHEHALYTPNFLYQHLPSMPHRSSVKPVPKDKIEGGVHPMCEFCRECFFSDDEIFAHMRERHEECFVCKRNGIRDQYFRNYQHLELHFTDGHFPCSHSECQAQKFVVFGTAMDLQAHVVEKHASTMSSKDKKDIRRVTTDFEFEEPGGSGNDRRRRRERDRDYESPPHRIPSSAPAASRAVGRRREGFGAVLTTESGPPLGSNAPVSQPRPIIGPQSHSQSGEDMDPIMAERHAAFASRLNALTTNSSSATAAIKSIIRSYKASESGARDLISTFFTILEQDLEATASLIISLVDLLEDEDRRRSLLAAWNGFKIEQRREFPDLLPTSAGSGYAGVAGGRVLNVKHSTGSRSSQQSTRQVWDRVARAAESSPSSVASLVAKPADRFPALQPSPVTGAMFRQPSHFTPWASSSAAMLAPSSNSASRVGPQPKGKGGAAPVNLSNLAFPTLPASSTARFKPTVAGNQSLRNIIGSVAAPPPVWGTSGKPGESESAIVEQDAGGLQEAASGGKGKKKKGKEKQTLFTLGTFPT